MHAACFTTICCRILAALFGALCQNLTLTGTF